VLALSKYILALRLGYGNFITGDKKGGIVLVRIIFLLACIAVAAGAYIQQYLSCVEQTGKPKKVMTNIIFGFLGSMVVTLVWYIISPYNSVLKPVQSSVVGIVFIWFISFIWEHFIDQSPDVIDTYARLLGATLPFVVIVLFSIL